MREACKEQLDNYFRGSKIGRTTSMGGNVVNFILTRYIEESPLMWVQKQPPTLARFNLIFDQNNKQAKIQGTFYDEKSTNHDSTDYLDAIARTLLNDFTGIQKIIFDIDRGKSIKYSGALEIRDNVVNGGIEVVEAQKSSVAAKAKT